MLMAAAVVFLPFIVSLDSVKHHIETKVSALTGGKIGYKQAGLEFVPWPRIAFTDCTIDIADRLTGTAGAVVVTLKPLSLLFGKIKIRSLGAVEPRLRIILPAPGQGSVRSFSSTKTAVEALGGIISGIPQAVKEDILLLLKTGRIEFVGENRPAFGFEDITGRVHLAGAQVSLKLSESLKKGGKLSLSLDFDAERSSGKAHFLLQHYPVEKTLAFFLPGGPVKEEGQGVDLKIDLSIQNAESFSGTVEGTSAGLLFFRENKEIALREGHLKGSVTVTPDKTEILISQLNLSNPGLKLSGHFTADRSTSTYEWEISAKDMDLESTGKTACALAPQSGVIRTVFQTLPAGMVRSVVISSQATSPAALKNAKRLRIKGFLEQGTVYIPKPDLTLTHATGWVSVADGVLEGNHLRAQLGNAKGQGAFSMTIQKKGPFLLDAVVEADLSELPPLLQRLVGNAAVKKEMGKITDASGTARGRLVIDKSHTGLALRVEVSRFDLSGNYERIPYPVRISGGRFLLDAEGARLENLKGRIGKSAFSGVSARIGKKSPFELDIQGIGLQADMEELLSWLRRYDAIAAKLRQFSKVTGGIHANTVSLKGPALSPSAWRFAVAGEVRDLTFMSPLCPGSILVSGGRFNADEQAIDFERTDIALLDTRMEIQGKLSNYLAGSYGITTTLMGAMGPQTAAWAKTQFNLPIILSWQAPRFMTPVHMRWEAQSGLALSGALRAEHGPTLEFALEKRPDELIIKKLTVQDDHSDATLSLRVKDRDIDLSFSGHLHNKTVDALVAGEPFLSGRVEGDFRSRIFLSAPQLLTAKGHLFVEALDLSNFNIPITIRRASLSGAETALRISGMQFEWEKKPLLLDGGIGRYRDGLELDLTIAAEEIAWKRISDLLTSKLRPEGRRIPLYGLVQARVERLALTEKIVLQPIAAQITFSGKETHLKVVEAMLCDIPISGAITKTPDAYRLEIVPAAKDRDLASTLVCLSGNDKNISGSFQLDGRLTAAGEAGTPISKALSGELAFAAEKGRIHRFGLAAKIFTLLNVAGLFQGELPDLEKEGFPFKTAKATVVFDNGILRITEGEIDSNAMNIFFQGEENLSTKTHDLAIVVAPLRTVDLLVSYIPLVRDILNKGLLIYPISVTGTWDAPELNLLAADAVGKEIWGIVIRTLKLPFKLFEPLFPEGSKTSAPEASPAEAEN